MGLLCMTSKSILRESRSCLVFYDTSSCCGRFDEAQWLDSLEPRNHVVRLLRKTEFCHIQGSGIDGRSGTTGWDRRRCNKSHGSLMLDAHVGRATKGASRYSLFHKRCPRITKCESSVEHDSTTDSCIFGNCHAGSARFGSADQENILRCYCTRRIIESIEKDKTYFLTSRACSKLSVWKVNVSLPVLPLSSDGVLVMSRIRYGTAAELMAVDPRSGSANIPVADLQHVNDGA